MRLHNELSGVSDYWISQKACSSSCFDDMYMFSSIAWALSYIFLLKITMNCNCKIALWHNWCISAYLSNISVWSDRKRNSFDRVMFLKKCPELKHFKPLFNRQIINKHQLMNKWVIKDKTFSVWQQSTWVILLCNLAVEARMWRTHINLWLWLKFKT